MTVLGLSCWYHDSAAALVRDGEILAAASEERFSRVKHDARFPEHAIRFCLDTAGIDPEGLDAVAFYDKPFLKFERLLESYLAYAPRGLRSFLKAMPLWLKKKLWIPDLVRSELGGYDGPLLFPEHHESHAASTFFPSPFRDAAFLTVDGVGEWATTSWGTGSGNALKLHAEIHFPHSLGLLYSAVTTFCGFRVNSGEYKLMGLAPYGTPRYADLMREHLIDLKPDGSFRLHPDAFEYVAGLRMTGRRFEDLFGGPARVPEAPLTQREMDLARSVQLVTEEALLAMARHVHRQTGADALCLAGGVALNCVANGRILRESPFRDVWVQPAAGDAGGALGAALAAYHLWHGAERTPQTPDAMHGAYLGPAHAAPEIEALLRAEDLPFERAASDADLCARVADLLAEGQSVGWFQGRMEFGPRALGHRSILADPRDPEAQRRVNLQVKFRESFRPFAPSVLAEHADALFAVGGEGGSGIGDGVPEEEGEAASGTETAHRQSSIGNRQSPYMLLVGPVRGARIEGEGFERLAHITSDVPAVTHVDGSARVQTVTAERSPLYHQLLTAFHERTGCPALVNTSFNVRGEPIVGTPADALRCFLNTHLDALALGPFILTKAALPPGRATALDADAIAATYGLD